MVPENPGKTRTQKFGSGLGRISLNKMSGFSGQTSENPKNSGRVSGIFGFLHTLQDAQPVWGQLEVKLVFAAKTLHTTKINETISA